jgi:hypothetical protein
MSMSDPFLPEPPERAADLAAEQEIEDVEEDDRPDVLEGEGDSPEEVAAAAHAAGPTGLRTPEPGSRLTAAELEAELD